MVARYLLVLRLPIFSILFTQGNKRGDILRIVTSNEDFDILLNFTFPKLK